MMKIIRIALITIALVSVSLASTACGGHSHAESTEQGKEYTSAYICPMYCDGSGSEEAGQCPVCGMDYVMNEKQQDTGHSHDGHSHDEHSHEGHSHDGHQH